MSFLQLRGSRINNVLAVPPASTGGDFDITLTAQYTVAITPIDITKTAQYKVSIEKDFVWDTGYDPGLFFDYIVYQGLLSTFKDSFDDNSISSKWVYCDPEVSEASGKIQFNIPDGAGAKSIQTDEYQIWDLDYAHIEIVEHDVDANHGIKLGIFIQDGLINGYVDFGVYGNNIIAYADYDGDTVINDSTTYVPTSHRWLRIRYNGGTLYFEAASERQYLDNNWQVITSTSYQSNKVIKIELEGRNNGSGIEYVGKIDNFNLIPTATTAQKSAQYAVDTGIRYWIGGTGDWSDTSHWSFTSGGSGGAPVPDYTKNVYFDASSFTVDNQTVTMTADAECKDFIWTGVTRPVTFSISGYNLQVYSNFTLSTSLTFSYTSGSDITFWRVSSGTSYIDTKGVVVKASITIAMYSGEALELLGPLNNKVSSSEYTSLFIDNSGGTFTTNNYTLTTYELSIDAQTSTCVLGSSTIYTQYLYCSATAPDFTGVDIVLNGSTTGYIYGSGTIKSITTNGVITYLYGQQSNAFTVNTITIAAGTSIKIDDGDTLYVGTIINNATIGSPISISSQVNGVQCYISKTSGTVTLDYATVTYNTATGGATWIKGTGFVGDNNNINGWQEDITITSTASYVVISSTDISKTAQYTVPYTRDVTKTAQYTVPKDYDITKTADYDVSRSTDVTKGAQYAVTRTIDVTKTADYDVSTSTDITKGAQYTVPYARDVTKSAQYVVASGIDIQKFAVYTVPYVRNITKNTTYAVSTTPSDKTKSSQYAVARQIDITKSASYLVSKTYDVTKTVDYDVARSSDITKNAAYAVALASSDYTINKNATYAIARSTDIQKSSSYVVISSEDVAKTAQYTVPKTYDATKAVSYSIAKSSDVTKTVVYDVLTNNIISKTAGYVVVSGQDIAKSSQYTTLSDVLVQKTASYTTWSIQTITVGYAYFVQRNIDVQLASSYRVTTTITVQKGAQFFVATTKDLSKTAGYVVESSEIVSKVAQYQVPHSIDVQKSVSYVVVSSEDASKVASYAVPYDYSIGKAVSYAIARSSDITKQAQYFVAVNKDIPKQATYAVSTTKDITKGSSYVVQSSGTAQKQAQYLVASTNRRMNLLLNPNFAGSGNIATSYSEYNNNGSFGTNSVSGNAQTVTVTAFNSGYRFGIIRWNAMVNVLVPIGDTVVLKANVDTTNLHPSTRANIYYELVATDDTIYYHGNEVGVGATSVTCSRTAPKVIKEIRNVFFAIIGAPYWTGTSTVVFTKASLQVLSVGETASNYVDGDSAGYQWLGTANNSYSQQTHLAIPTNYLVGSSKDITNQASYAVTSLLDITKQAIYTVPFTYTKQITASYVVNTGTEVFLPTTYKVLGIVTLTQQAQYYVARSSAIEKQAQYLVAIDKGIQKQSEYLVGLDYDITKNIAYNVAPTITVQKQMVYVVISSEEISKVAQYTVPSTGNIQKTNDYDVAVIRDYTSGGTEVLCDSYGSANYFSISSLRGGSYTRLSQSFTGNGGQLSKARFYLKKNGTPTGNINVYLYSHSGTYGSNSVPSTLLATSTTTYPIANLTTSVQWVQFNFNQYTLTNGTRYVLVIEYTGGDSTNRLDIGTDSQNPVTHSGNMALYFGTWIPSAGIDTIFEVYTGIPLTNGLPTAYSVSKNVTITKNAVYEVVRGISKTSEYRVARTSDYIVSSVVDGYTTTSNFEFYISSNEYHRVGQSFTGDGGILSTVVFKVYRYNNPTGNMYYHVYEHTGTFGSDGLPTGSPIATSDPINVSTLLTSGTLTAGTFSGANRITLNAGQKYVAVIEYTGGNSSNDVTAQSSSSGTHNGNVATWNWNSSSWSYLSADLIFSVTSSNHLLAEYVVLSQTTITKQTQYHVTYGVDGNITLGSSYAVATQTDIDISAQYSIWYIGTITLASTYAVSRLGIITKIARYRVLAHFDTPEITSGFEIYSQAPLDITASLPIIIQDVEPQIMTIISRNKEFIMYDYRQIKQLRVQ